jgi:hypothetical protein
MKLKLKSEIVEAARVEAKLTPEQIGMFLGMTRQGYKDMIKRRSPSRSAELAKLFSIEEKDLVVIE